MMPTSVSFQPTVEVGYGKVAEFISYIMFNLEPSHNQSHWLCWAPFEITHIEPLLH